MFTKKEIGVMYLKILAQAFICAMLFLSYTNIVIRIITTILSAWTINALIIAISCSVDLLRQK